MFSERHIYHHETQALHGHLVYDKTSNKKRPAVLIIHDWSGQNEFARQKARWLAEQNYIAFAVDLYGDGQIGQTTEEKQALMHPLITNRAFLLARLQASLNEIKRLPQVNPHRIGIIGFCFGGLCALDLARSGAEINAVVSLHGLLHRDPQWPLLPIAAKLLVLHGYDDPMVKPQNLISFCEEMNQVQAHWEINMYGQTQHAFTNPEANDAALGTLYNPETERRALRATQLFLADHLS